jgi:hypothetical protein
MLNHQMAPVQQPTSQPLGWLIAVWLFIALPMQSLGAAPVPLFSSFDSAAPVPDNLVRPADVATTTTGNNHGLQSSKSNSKR